MSTVLDQYPHSQLSTMHPPSPTFPPGRGATLIVILYFASHAVSLGGAGTALFVTGGGGAVQPTHSHHPNTVALEKSIHALGRRIKRGWVGLKCMKPSAMTRVGLRPDAVTECATEHRGTKWHYNQPSLDIRRSPRIDLARMKMDSGANCAVVGGCGPPRDFKRTPFG